MTNQQELIDQYHSGNMTPEQIVDFEKQLESNPELKAESNFQSDIINGLREVRKSELKTRLNAIDMNPGWMEFVHQSTLVKSFGGVALATLIGSGVYLYAEKQEFTNDNQIAIEISAPQQEELEFNYDYIEVANTDESNNVENTLLSQEMKADKSEVEISSSAKEETSTVPAPKLLTPDFNAPDPNLIEEDGNFEAADLDVLPSVTTSAKKEIDVSTENVKNVNIKYKYYDGKLFLSGDFDKAPYEILEINSARGRRIYIQYLDKYYQVNTTDKLSDLPEVTDQKLIQELKLLKDNK